MPNLISQKSMDRIRERVGMKRPGYPLVLSTASSSSGVSEPPPPEVPPVPEHLRAMSPNVAPVTKPEDAFDRRAYERPTEFPQPPRLPPTTYVFDHPAHRPAFDPDLRPAPLFSPSSEPGPQILPGLPPPPRQPQAPVPPTPGFRSTRPAARAPNLSLVCEERDVVPGGERRQVPVRLSSTSLNRAALTYAARVLTLLAAGQTPPSADELSPADIEALGSDVASLARTASSAVRSRSDSDGSSLKSAKPRNSGLD